MIDACRTAARSGRATSVLGLLGLLVVVVAFGLTTPRFLTAGTFRSVAFQLPELGLLTLAMLIPILSGGLNLAVTFTANICGLALAWVLQADGGAEAGAALSRSRARRPRGRRAAGGVMGLMVAYFGAHPILVSLA